MKKFILIVFLFLSACAFSQVSPQIQGAGPPTNPCYNGGQQYVDQTNHVIYNCSVPGSNWVNIGIGQNTGNTQCTGAGNAFYSGAGSALSCDTSVVDNGTGLVTFSGTTGPFVILPNGTATNTALNHAANAANTGWFSSSASSECWANTGNVKSCFNNAGNVVGDGAGYVFSQTNLASGTSGAQINVTGTGATEYITSSTPVVDSGKCQINALAINNATTTLCTFTLPNAATALRIDCRFAQIYSTATTLGLGYTFAQTPTLVSMSADIKTTNTNTATEATITTANTSNNVILTGATPGATGTFQAEAFGTFTSSATSGTLLITAIAGAASDLTMSGGCYVH